MANVSSLTSIWRNTHFARAFDNNRVKGPSTGWWAGRTDDLGRQVSLLADLAKHSGRLNNLPDLFSTRRNVTTYGTHPVRRVKKSSGG